MSEIYLNPTIQLHLKVAKPAQLPSPLSVTFKTAPDTVSPGEPGKQTGDLTLLAQPDGKKLAIVSLGSAKKVKAETFRLAGGALGRWLVQSGASDVDLNLAELDTLGIPGAFTALLEGLRLGAYRFDHYKTGEVSPSQVTVFIRAAQAEKETTRLVERVQKVTEAVDLSRTWAHEPASVINPLTLAERAQAMAKQYNLKCTVLDDKGLAELKAGAILAVGKGSQTPSRLIIIEYPGNGAPADAKPVVLVGKALTFDSGGYSLKDSTNIQSMKYDKSGGVTVLATLKAAAMLKLKTPIVGIIGAAENMVSAQAYRPDDIITSLSGKTIEVISTDAEGRLVLADALTYAQQHFQSKAIIDLATLTGGVVVALGHVRAGIMSNNDELTQQLVAAGESTYERLWRLPLDEEFLKQIKGDDSDLKNSGGREGHAIIGGIFLHQFVDDQIPWAHLDIAGMADTNKDTLYCPKGGTGFGVRLLIDYLENL